jgi:hypothetical protein
MGDFFSINGGIPHLLFLVPKRIMPVIQIDIYEGVTLRFFAQYHKKTWLEFNIHLIRQCNHVTSTLLMAFYNRFDPT